VLGIVGGSGIYELPGSKNAQNKIIETPWGEPSGPLLTGEIAGLPIVFLSRHDKGHRLSPSDTNYRANIDVLIACGRDRSRFALGLRLARGDRHTGPPRDGARGRAER
jgi:5'-methylthioadenosine phosphorylase